MYEELKAKFEREYGHKAEYIFSAPGRTELGGNHTDHQHGLVLAAAVTLDTKAAAAENNDDCIRVISEGYAPVTVRLDELAVHSEERNTTAALVRGVAAGFVRRGYGVRGFDAYGVSDVLPGSGLSSSAAFEVLLGTITSYLYNDGSIDPVTVAKVAQYSENVFFGKPCGLLDQMASSVGAFVTIDFESTQEPVIQKVDYDFAASGHSLCIVDTGGNHSDLTDDYAAIRSEMEAVAHAMGKSVLRQVAYEDFFAALPELQTKVNDRALIRAIHFYNDNRRVEDAVSCLEQGNFDGFLADINASGRSSFMYNQNVFTTKNPTDQRLSLALAISGQVLGDRGAYRVHGGGFAGTIQAFVPNDLLEQYRTVLEGVFGEGTCHVLQVRPVGGACLA